MYQKLVGFFYYVFNGCGKEKTGCLKYLRLKKTKHFFMLGYVEFVLKARAMAPITLGILSPC